MPPHPEVGLPGQPLTTRPQDSRLLERERIANRPKHWVRVVTACNSRCLFCLDADTPRNVYLPVAEVEGELRRGIEVLGADKVILSGGEASLHPGFPSLIRSAKAMGYDRVQTVTNGHRFAELAFYKTCMEAGLGEITFSLHGHTAALHDHLTQVPGAFDRLMKGMIRAIRDPRGPIVNVDIVINKQNVGVLDKIVELAASVGVREFDLLHVIPQANAFDNRDEMFYDVREYLPILQKVFRLGRHPRFVIWTNRFPVEFLEGMEELIQDPHKMLDEVNGRRFMVRNYLDSGKPLDCRDPARCVHCFIEPFCTTMDRTIAAHRQSRVAVWELPAGSPPPERLPPLGIRYLRLAEPPEVEQLHRPISSEVGWELTDVPHLDPQTLPDIPLRIRLTTPTALSHWLAGPLAPQVELEIHLNRETEVWLLEHRDVVHAAMARMGDHLRLHQPSHEHVAQAIAADIRDPKRFFDALGLIAADLHPPVSGLPACLCPGGDPVPAPFTSGPDRFDPETGRLDIRSLARDHVRSEYRCKSVRCSDCVLSPRCEGIHINMVRDQGLALCRPLDPALPETERVQALLHHRWPNPPARVRDGSPTEPPAPSLPGFAPVGPTLDPLAAVALKLQERREARARARAAGEALPPANPFSPRAALSEGPTPKPQP